MTLPELLRETLTLTTQQQRSVPGCIFARQMATFELGEVFTQPRLGLSGREDLVTGQGQARNVHELQHRASEGAEGPLA
jgi:hypothetical protein